MLPLLEQLNADNSVYVRKSVANHLNDISKDNPDIVVNLCRGWQTHAALETQWIIRHGTRTLIKSGHPGALQLLGFNTRPAININQFKIAKKQIILGENLAFSFSLTSTSAKPQKLVIDYVIHHVKANGSTTPKVFKLKTLVFPAKETITFNKQHAFKAITTRQYYAGTHRLTILINGNSVQDCDFVLAV